MHIIRGYDDAMRLSFLRVRTAAGLFHLLLALTVHVYVFPGPLANEGQLVGFRAHDLAILRVELLGVLRALAAHIVPGRIDVGGGGELGAGELAERMEVDVVDADGDDVDKIER
jgi:hypothetical protein